jgi:two-component system response regulator PrrA
MSAKPRVLVASPDRDWCRLLEMVLGRIGYGVSSSPSGRELISTAVAQCPQAIILDRELPDLAGEEVLKGLRAFEATRSIPAILLIRRQLDPGGVTVLRADRDQILEKPFSLKALCGSLDRALHRAAAR